MKQVELIMSFEVSDEDAHAIFNSHVLKQWKIDGEKWVSVSATNPTHNAMVEIAQTIKNSLKLSGEFVSRNNTLECLDDGREVGIEYIRIS